LLKNGLAGIQARTGKIEALRIRGLMAAVDLADTDPVGFATHVQRQLRRAGYIVAQRPGLNVLRIDPPLTIARQDLAGFLDAFETVLTAPAAD
jgi:4-aminobutyrate aminotransferase-like enzyme